MVVVVYTDIWGNIWPSDPTLIVSIVELSAAQSSSDYCRLGFLLGVV